MAGICHYERLVKNPRTGETKLEKTEVHFTTEQCATDELILKRFEALELAVSKGSAVKGTRAVKEVEDLLDGVPEPRLEHWLKELERIGAVDPTPTKKEEKPAAATGAGK
jgi:hypothetical protein